MSLLVGTRRALLGGGGVIAPFARDSFTDANTTALQSHAADDAGTWTRHTGASNATIQANRVMGAASGTLIYYHSATPPSANYRVRVTIVKAGTSSTTNGPIARWNTSAVTGYFGRYNEATGGWELFKSVAGTATQLGSTVLATLTLLQAYVFDLVTIGDAISLVVDGVTLVAVTDSAVTAAGKAGLRITGGFNASAGIHADSFEAVAA